MTRNHAPSFTRPLALLRGLVWFHGWVAEEVWDEIRNEARRWKLTRTP